MNDKKKGCLYYSREEDDDSQYFYCIYLDRMFYKSRARCEKCWSNTNKKKEFPDERNT